MMDNRLFNVNGRGDDMLLAALELAFMQDGDNATAKHWGEFTKHGLILARYVSNSTDMHPFPAGQTAVECLPTVLAWLKGDFAKTVEFGKWCGNADHDGHNTKGWQVYVDDWGHVGSQTSAICAIRPAYCWHGK